MISATGEQQAMPMPPASTTVQAGWGRLKSNQFIRSASVMSGGSALGHLFTLAAGPILTRIYGPAEFGVLGLFTSFISIVGVGVTLQYEVSIPSGRDEREAAYLTFGSLLLTAPLSLLAAVLLWILIRTSALGFGSLPPFAPLLLALSLAFIGVFSSLRYWSLRASQFGAIAQGTLVQSAGRAVFQTILGSVGFHSSGLLIGETLGRCVGVSKMLRSSWPALTRTARTFRWQALRHIFWRQRKFPLYSFPSSLLDALCLGLTLPLLVHIYGVSTGGYYSVVWKAITVPSVLITAAVADSFHGRLAICVRDTPERVTDLFRKLSVALLILGLIPTLTVRFFGPELFGWIFGARWALSGVMAAIVAPWYLAQFVVSPLSRVVFVLSGQEMKLAWDVLCLASLLGIFAFAQWRGLSALQTIKILSAAYTVLFAAYYLVLLRVIANFNKAQREIALPA